MTLALFWVHEATVQTYAGETSTGSVYAAPVTFFCFVDDARKLVVTSDGEELASSTTIFASPTYASLFTPDSKVTSPQFSDGRIARVVNVNSMTSGPLDLPDHVQVDLL
jgi:hypothetical protein